MYPRPKSRLRIFVDFWNFQLGLSTMVGHNFQIDWKILPRVFTDRVQGIVGDSVLVSYEAMHVFMSYNPDAAEDAKLRKWAENTLKTFAGVDVVCTPRDRKGFSKCPVCHKEIRQCAECRAEIKQTVEKGVDTALVTSMLQLAWEDSWDIAVLASADKDFIPAVAYLKSKGYKVINAHIPPRGKQLAGECWSRMDVSDFFKCFERTR